jgi:UDP-N-acetylmuramate--alanine ligase
MSRRPWQDRHLHFIGIGGCGMSGLALVANRLGAQVSGSDRTDGPFVQRLRSAGITVTIGHTAGAAPDGAEVVVSSAVPEVNVERSDARLRELPELTRGQLLAELAALHRCIAVAGTHGKSTTAAMIVQAMRGAGHAVDFIIGADVLPARTNAEWDDGSWLVVETDESDRSLLELCPEIGVVTNVDYDHVDTYASLSDVEVVFEQFLRQSQHAVVWKHADLPTPDQPSLSTFDAPCPLLTRHGSEFDWRATRVRLRVPGAHNARNAAAALEACLVAGADPAAAAAALADFQGVARRFELAGATSRGALIYDDYAHHPAEVEATLSAARVLEPERLVAVLRPWGAARVLAMADAFGASLAGADSVVVLDVAGGPSPLLVSADLIVRAARAASPGLAIAWMPDVDVAVRQLHDALDRGTICVTFGCGDIAARLVAPPTSTTSTPAPATVRS